MQICKPFFSFIGGTSGGRTHDKRIKSTIPNLPSYHKPSIHAPSKRALTKSIKVCINVTYRFLTTFRLRFDTQKVHHQEDTKEDDKEVTQDFYESCQSNQRIKRDCSWISKVSDSVQDKRISLLLGSLLHELKIQS